jgi:Fe-S cluster assembly ATP-binding protein
MLSIRNLFAGIEDKEILKGFNLVCKKGQTNALVGPSGRFLYFSI